MTGQAKSEPFQFQNPLQGLPLPNILKRTGQRFLKDCARLIISAACRETFVCGQVTSIEPGYYLENNYGVRIENLAEVVDSSYQDFLMFSPLTLVPIDKNAINKYLLSKEEIKWLDDYHQKVFEKISPFLNSAEKEWLSEACAPL